MTARSRPASRTIAFHRASSFCNWGTAFLMRVCNFATAAIEASVCGRPDMLAAATAPTSAGGRLAMTWSMQCRSWASFVDIMPSKRRACSQKAKVGQLLAPAAPHSRGCGVAAWPHLSNALIYVTPSVKLLLLEFGCPVTPTNPFVTGQPRKALSSHSDTYAYSRRARALSG